MADTPTETPKRRRTTKPAEAKATASKPAAKPKKANARAATQTEKPIAPKRTPKPQPATEKTAAPANTVAATPTKARKARAAKAEAAAAPSSAAPTRSPAPSSAADRSEPVPRLGWVAALGAAAAIGGAWFVWRSSRADEPGYQTIEQDGTVEVRKYPSLVTAAATNNGERRQALNDGFQTLADYIFAKSRPGPKLAMTAPVLSDRVDGHWRTRFVMPVGKARAALPDAPAGVEIATEPAGRFAAIRFSGKTDDDILEQKEQELRSWLQTKSYPHEGRAVHAFYNAPFLPGPMRRNEVLIMLSNEGGTGS